MLKPLFKPVLLTLALAASLSASATAAPVVREIAAIGAEPSQVLWLGRQAVVTQKAQGTVLLWDQQQLHSLTQLSDCRPSSLVATRDQHFLLACSQDPRLLVMNTMGQIMETFPRPEEEMGLVRNSASSQSLDLSGVTAMVLDGRGGTYLAVAGSNSPDESSRGKGRIYYLSPSRSSLTVVASKLNYPAGMVLSNDGTGLFVSEGLSRQVSRFDVLPGQLSNPQLVAKLADIYTPSATASEDPWPGALAINSQNHLYIALPGDGRILVTSLAGKPLASLQVPAPYITDFSFSRTDRIIYITATNTADAGAAGHLYEVRL